MVAAKASPTERRDVAKFLAAHEECASDFEIRRMSGGGQGRLRLTCNGCGVGAAYDAAEPGVLKLIDVAPDRPQRLRKDLTRAEVERWLPAPAALPWWVPNAYILAVIAVGLAMIAFGVLRPRDEDRAVLGGQEPTATQPQQPAVDDPAPAPGPTAGDGSVKGAVGSGSAAKGKDGGSTPGGRAEAKVKLNMITVVGRFEIGVPPGWQRGLGGGAVIFRAPGQEAELRIFFEAHEDGTQYLAREAEEFLASEHPGAQIRGPSRIRIGGEKALGLVARWKGGKERAALLSESGYSYLLLSRVDDGAQRPSRRGVLAALYSFDAL